MSPGAHTLPDRCTGAPACLRGPDGALPFRALPDGALTAAAGTDVGAALDAVC